MVQHVSLLPSQELLAALLLTRDEFSVLAATCQHLSALDVSGASLAGAFVVVTVGNSSSVRRVRGFCVGRSYAVLDGKMTCAVSELRVDRPTPQEWPALEAAAAGELLSGTWDHLTYHEVIRLGLTIAALWRCSWELRRHGYKLPPAPPGRLCDAEYQPPQPPLAQGGSKLAEAELRDRLHRILLVTLAGHLGEVQSLARSWRPWSDAAARDVVCCGGQTVMAGVAIKSAGSLTPLRSPQGHLEERERKRPKQEQQETQQQPKQEQQPKEEQQQELGQQLQQHEQRGGLESTLQLNQRLLTCKSLPQPPLPPSPSSQPPPSLPFALQPQPPLPSSSQPPPRLPSSSQPPPRLPSSSQPPPRLPSSSQPPPPLPLSSQPPWQSTQLLNQMQHQQQQHPQQQSYRHYEQQQQQPYQQPQQQQLYQQFQQHQQLQTYQQQPPSGVGTSSSSSGVDVSGGHQQVPMRTHPHPGSRPQNCRYTWPQPPPLPK